MIMLPFDIHAIVFGEYYHVGLRDPEDYSLIRLIHDVKILVVGCRVMPWDRMNVKIVLPWNDERVDVVDDRELMSLFTTFDMYEYDDVYFELEMLPLDTIPLVSPQPTIENPKEP